MKNKKLTLGLDCGGTNIKIALVDVSGNMLESALEPMSYQPSPEKAVKTIADRVKKFIGEHGVKQKDLEGIGVGIAGEVDRKDGFVRFAPNIGWKNIAFGKFLRRHFDVPVIVDNDANCAGWGAYWLDAKRDCKNLICLTLGTGVGGGIIVEGKLLRGSTGSAGEIGHMSIDYRGRVCKCGNFGCIETLVAAGGIVQTVEEGLKNHSSPILKKRLQGPKKVKLSPKVISEAANKGDPFCQKVWKEVGEQLGSALANLVNIFNPDRIILCGGISKSGDLLLRPALQVLSQRAFATPAQQVKVSVSEYNDRLGVIGAALLLRE